MSETLSMLAIGPAIVAAFMLGLSFGSGPCNLSCLPYLGPVLLGPAAQTPLAAVLLPFMAGRLSGYVLLGGLAALAGQLLQPLLQHPALPWLAAAVTLWLAWRLWRQAVTSRCQGSARPTVTAQRNLIASDAPRPNRHPWPLYVLGLSLAFNPCIPLLALLSAAAHSGDWRWGVAVALSFGVGAIIIPLALARYVLALLGRELRQQLARWQQALTRTGALLLVFVALNTALRGIPG